MTCNTYNLGGGVTFIGCGPTRKIKCKVCGAPAEYLCDEPLTGAKAGKTCDVRICDRCATQVDRDRHLCPPHARARELRIAEQTLADAWLADLIAEEAAREAVEHARQTSAMPVSDKVRHVKRAVQTRAHGCHWPGCSAQVKPALWGCAKHWYMLPEGLRSKIWAAYRPGQEDTLTPSRTYVAVAREVQDWIVSYEARQHRARCRNPNTCATCLAEVGEQPDAPEFDGLNPGQGYD